MALAGVAFLSGGQKEEESTVNLNAINKIAISRTASGQKPWPLTFCFGRALLGSAFKSWASNESDKNAQEWLIRRSTVSI